ncbi:hypothetical protein SLS59_007479 [Nothophoma quercina]|uniref:GRIP domain-containing protein n=1 Tax=Nothophoma quercina TaxID=749835 RepID=A0ABR3QZX8_9PLEO
MSAPATADPVNQSGTTSKSKKKKNKKKGGSKEENKVEEGAQVNGNYDKAEAEHDDNADEEEEQTKPAAAQTVDRDADDVDDEQPLSPSIAQSNGKNPHSIASAVALGFSRSRSPHMSPSPPSDSETTARLDAIAKERDALRQEVTQLRKSLESIQSQHEGQTTEGAQSKHEEEVQALREELEEANEGKEHFETQYNNLLGRVNTIKTSLGNRMKADAAKIEEYEAQVAELQDQNGELQEKTSSLSEELAKLRQEIEAQASEISNLRSRSNLSQQNWVKERDELISREAYAREEFENAKQAMQDWEVLAMNERSLRESLSEKEAELKEQLESLKDDYERAARDRDQNNQAVEGLQKALQEVQNLRRSELKKSVETYEPQINDLRKQVQAAEEASKAAKASVDSTQKELERALPFEKEVKEKNLLIGKLRHEAVTLNEHLTKALRILKKGRPEDNVDKQIITNYFLHFLALDRSDPKKFEALQLISMLLGWTDEQKEQAGLARPGTSSRLGIPASPFRRTPSTPSLSSMSDPMLMASSSSNKESLAELWQDFLEREAAEGRDGKDVSRRGSTIREHIPGSYSHVKPGNYPYVEPATPQIWTPVPNKPVATPPPNKVIVKVQLEAEDLNWLLKLLPEWRNQVITIDKAFAHLHDSAQRVDKGRIADAYLTWIITNYNNLAETVVFVPPGLQKQEVDKANWRLPHKELVNSIENLQIPHVQKFGYAPLHCPKKEECEDTILPFQSLSDKYRTLDVKMAEMWEQMFNNTHVPEQLASPSGRVDEVLELAG